VRYKDAQRDNERGAGEREASTTKLHIRYLRMLEDRKGMQGKGKGMGGETLIANRNRIVVRRRGKRG
jgi:hypothetical protein